MSQYIASLLHGKDAMNHIGEEGMAGAMHVASVISFVQSYAEAISKKV